MTTHNCKSERMTPLRTRILVLAWLAVYIPSYLAHYGGWHFLQLCNLSILISSVGLLLGNSLLISSQTLAMSVISLLWVADFFCAAFLGHFLHGGTAYMWSPTTPVLVRILSLYHVFWPPLLLLKLHDIGYHEGSFRLQTAFAATAILIGLILAPQSENLNYVFHWPNGRLLFDDVALHALSSFLLMAFFVYLPSHWLLKMCFTRHDLFVDSPNQRH